MASADTWSCAQCTFENINNRLTCEICQSPRRNNEEGALPVNQGASPSQNSSNKVVPKQDSARSTTSSSEEWNCYRCSYTNNSARKCCEMCEAPRLNVVSNNGLPSPPSSSCPQCSSAVPSCPSCLGRRNRWVCSKCTFENPMANALCGACSTPNPTRHKPSPIKTKQQSDSWQCSKCKKTNVSTDTKCGSCGQAANLSAGIKPNSPLPRFLQRQTSSYTEDLRRSDEKTARESWERIVTYCESNKHNFIDDSFPLSQKSIGDLSNDGLPVAGAANQNSLIWCRPDKIYTRDGLSAGRWTIFRDPQPTDIQQGILGNCWFLVALAVISERPALLKQIVITSDYCKWGVYQIRLCIDGKWTVVLVDDFFPCHPNRTLAFSEGRRNQLWVPLIEKALAKVHGSYGALNAGRSTEGLAILTGAPCEALSLESSVHNPNDSVTEDEIYNQDMLWVRLLSSYEAGFLMGCSCGAGHRVINDQEFERVGLCPRHAYSVLEIRELNGFRLVRLRNPWGRYVWNGAWSDKSDIWTDDLRRQLMPQGPKAGVFWMPFEEFSHYFDSVDICKVRENWNEKRITVLFAPHALETHFRLTRLTVLETTEIDLTLYQQGYRSSEPMAKKHAELDLMILVFKEGFKEGDVGSYVTTSGRRVQSSTSCHQVFTPGVYLVLSVAFNHWGMDLRTREMPQGILSLHSAQQIVLESLHARPLCLADALIELCLHKANRKAVLPGLSTYYLCRGYGGMILMVENATENQFAQVGCDCTGSENVTSTRAAMVTVDCIPPLHRQIIVVLSHCEHSQNYSVCHKLQYVTSAYSGLNRLLPQRPRALHEPEISQAIQGLHFPRPLYL